MIFAVFCVALAAFNIMFYQNRSSYKDKLFREDQVFREILTLINNDKNETALHLLEENYPPEKFSGSDVIWYIKGRIRFGQKDYASAKEMFARAREINPLLLRSYDFLYYYGLSLSAMGDRQHAAKILETAVLVFPGHQKNMVIKPILAELKNGR